MDVLYDSLMKSHHCFESVTRGSLRGSGATEAISLYLGHMITGKNGEIATPACAVHADRLPLVARDDAGEGDIPRLTHFHLTPFP